MSEKFTSIESENGLHLGEWGHVNREEAIEKLRCWAYDDLKRAVATLQDIEAGRVRVFHQYGPLARRNRHEVKPDKETP